MVFQAEGTAYARAGRQQRAQCWFSTSGGMEINMGWAVSGREEQDTGLQR